jgi:dTDP-4-dehydrorhamnose 3,5-epimerase
MKFEELALKDLILITPNVFGDERGFFLESYNKDTFTKNGLHMEFVQDNHSKSSAGVIRGLHYQEVPHAQGKLVRCIKGSIIDVVVDLRKKSPTFSKVAYIPLDDKKMQMVYVPEGFAHGFITLTECEVQYKCTNIYNKGAEGGIRWNDPTLNIQWGIDNPIVSEKDRVLPTFNEMISTCKF